VLNPEVYTRYSFEETVFADFVIELFPIAQRSKIRRLEAF